ncbi:hypothetical protein RSAG8_06951, partial [Rhizoctonia solani AG-8 WAC10335]
RQICRVKDRIIQSQKEEAREKVFQGIQGLLQRKNRFVKLNQNTGKTHRGLAHSSPVLTFSREPWSHHSTTDAQAQVKTLNARGTYFIFIPLPRTEPLCQGHLLRCRHGSRKQEAS